MGLEWGRCYRVRKGCPSPEERDRKKEAAGPSESPPPGVPESSSLDGDRQGVAERGAGPELRRTESGWSGHGGPGIPLLDSPVLNLPSFSTAS